MPEMPSRAKIEVSFQELQEHYEGHDIGLEVFDERIRRLTDNANEDGGSFSDLIEPGIDTLNKQWFYHEDPARITGRLYVVDGSIKDELAERWGEPDKDENGNLSIFVEDAELISFGIVDGPHGNRIDETRIEAKIGYGFTLSGSDSPMIQLILYPGESSQHVYPLPTPEAIDVRLHSTWPDKMKRIDELLAYEDEDIPKLPRRLTAIARILQDELAGSSDYREWLSIYVNDRLDLNKVWPYVVTVADRMYFLDDDTGQDWLEMSIEGTARLDVRNPRIEFIRADSDGAVKSMFFAELPDTRDEWEGTPIGVNAADIVGIRGTRTYRTIIDIALQSHEMNIAAALRSSAIEEDDPTSDQPVVSIKPSRREHHTGDPSNIEEMRLLRDEIKAVIDMVAPIAKKTYDTFERAREVSTALSNTIGNRLIGGGISNFALKFEGEYALRAATIQGNDRPAEPGEIIIRANAENPYPKLQHGDNFMGTFYAVLGDVISNEDENGETTSYQAHPRLIVDVRSKSASALEYSGVPMLEATILQRGMITLDGTVDITIPSLERYEADKAARAAVATELGERHVMTNRVNSLFAAFMSETDAGYQDLKRIEDIRKLARHIGSHGEGEKVVFDALSSMLMNRSIMASGSEGETDAEDNIRFVDGIVADIRTSLPDKDSGGGPFMIVLDKQDGEYHALRLSTLESLAF